jgi:hypothetical protein
LLYIYNIYIFFFCYHLNLRLRRPFCLSVLVVQHDYVFVSPVFTTSIIQTMESNPAVKYIGIPSPATRQYCQQMKCKYQLSLNPKPFSLGGKDSICDFDTSSVYLIPLLFWYDKNHFASTEHYRNFVFGGQFQCVKKGSFIEDTLGQEQLKDIKTNGLEAHAKFGTYLLLPDVDLYRKNGLASENNLQCEEVVTIRHCHGRCFITLEQRKKLGYFSGGSKGS